jgi:hypothetical protein
MAQVTILPSPSAAQIAQQGGFKAVCHRLAVRRVVAPAFFRIFI